MNSTPRETQFAGFAKALLQEMMGELGYLDFNEWDEEEIARHEKLIAQRAYDLAHHVLRCNGIDIGFWDRRASDLYENEIITDLAAIPDLTALPEMSQ